MNTLDIKARIFSFLLHVFFVLILYLVGSPKEFKHNDEQFEIIDADIVGVINQSKAQDVKIEEKIVKKEVAPSIENAKEEKIEEKKEEERKSEKKLEEKVESKFEEKVESKSEKIEEKLEEKVLEKKEVKEEDLIPEKTIEKKKEEKPKLEEEKLKKEEKKPELEKPKDDIKKGEAKKIDDVLKKIEAKDDLEDLKKSLNKANNVLKNLDANEKKNVINKNIQSNNLVGGGDVATAKLGSYIKSQLIACWKIPPLIGVEVENIKVILQIRLDKSGNVLNTKIVNNGQYGRSQFFDLIAESATQAVNACSPIKNLPQERYNDWKDVQLVFDPSKFVS